MKLLFCDKCFDIVALRAHSWRFCGCVSIGGQYNHDGVTATIGGKGRVFGISNFFLSREWLSMTERQRNKLRSKNYPKGQKSDCWWGGYVGDQQLLWIKSPVGPRLKTVSKIVEVNGLPMVQITAVDHRWVWVDKKIQRKVIIPNYTGIQLTKTPR